MGLRQSLLFNPCGGCLFIFWLWICSFLGSMFIMAPSLLLLPFRPEWFRAWNDRAITGWLHLPTALLQMLFGIRFVLTADPTLDTVNENVIVLNHRTFFDWLFLWAVLSNRGGLSQEKIVLKSVPPRMVRVASE